jgi:hypothetical protein
MTEPFDKLPRRLADKVECGDLTLHDLGLLAFIRARVNWRTGEYAATIQELKRASRWPGGREYLRQRLHVLRGAGELSFDSQQGQRRPWVFRVPSEGRPRIGTTSNFADVPDLEVTSNANDAPDAAGDVQHGHHGGDKLPAGGPYIEEERKKTTSGGDGATPSPSAKDLVSLYVREARARGVEPPRRSVGQAARIIAELIAEGFTPYLIAQAIELMLDRDRGPSALPSFLMEAQRHPQIPGIGTLYGSHGEC